jgi:hypothetical protein
MNFFFLFFPFIVVHVHFYYIFFPSLDSYLALDIFGGRAKLGRKKRRMDSEIRSSR